MLAESRGDLAAGAKTPWLAPGNLRASQGQEPGMRQTGRRSAVMQQGSRMRRSSPSGGGSQIGHDHALPVADRVRARMAPSKKARPGHGLTWAPPLPGDQLT